MTVRWATAGLGAALVACGSNGVEGKPDSGASAGVEPAGETGTLTAGETSEPTGETEPTGAITEASCSRQEANPLRFDCQFTTTAAVALSVAWGGRTFDSPAGVEHRLTLWGVPPETTAEFVATAEGGTAVGTLATGALPAQLDGLEVTTSGSLDEEVEFVLPQSCDGTGVLVRLNQAGQVVWYQDFAGSTITGFHWTEDDAAIVGLGDDTVLEVGASGEERWRETGFDYPLHHHLDVAGDRVYVQDASTQPVGSEVWVIDGVTSFPRGGGTRTRWLLSDHVPLVGDAQGGFWDRTFPGALDWAHGNSIEVDEDGHGLLSLRWLDAVVEYVADPAAPDYGAVRQILASTGSPLEGDVTLDGFDGQHHANWQAGRLTVFDNGGRSENSRAERYRVDGSVGVLESAFDLGQHCEIQGAAYELPDGGLLATCADGGFALGFGPSGGSSTFRIEVACGASGGGPGGGGPGGGTSRILPVTR